MNSFAYDYVARARCGGLHLNFFVIRETVLPHADRAATLGKIGRQLIATGTSFAREWVRSTTPLCSWRSLWAVSAHERLRLRCILDAAVASLYGVTQDDLGQMLNGCDYPADRLGDDDFTRTLDPKGFWRVDKEKPPELRHTVLSLVAFRDLQAMGLERFVNEWQLPTALRLSDYDPGRDDRARETQPVAVVLGPRLLEWQTGATPRSWEECARHAELLEKIVPTAPPAPEPEETEADEDGQIPMTYAE